jgi:hypothetical protein
MLISRTGVVKRSLQTRLPRLATTSITPSHLHRLPLAPHSLPYNFPSPRLFTTSRPRLNLETLTMPSADASTYPTAPVRPPKWSSLTAASIPIAVDESIKKGNAVLDRIASLPPSDRTFETVCRPYALAMGDSDREIEPSLFLQYVSTDEAIREASVAGDKKVQEWSLESMTRVDIYEALLDAKKHTEKEGIKLEDEEKRLLERLIMDRKRNGLGLDKAKREEYLQVRLPLSLSSFPPSPSSSFLPLST